MKIIKLLIISVFFLTALSISAKSQNSSKHFECLIGKTVLPARYDEHRFIVEPITSDGKKLSFYTDTGGGLFIHQETAEKLNLTQPNSANKEPIDLPSFKTTEAIPKPLGSNGKLYVLKKNPKGNHFINQLDGMLGQAWFADRIWIFDYPNQKLILQNNPCKTIKENSENVTKLWFKTDEKGKRLISFPRIQIEVAGENIDLLFDTGATTVLTENAIKTLNDGKNKSRATSFITKSIFEKWRKNNPEWQVIENAESNSGEAMIEVPKIKIANQEVGPIWFTRRADKNFHEYMTRFMDKKIEGAIGGNALKYFKVTVDYPHSIALFEKE